jgi:hypothetical protein
LEIAHHQRHFCWDALSLKLEAIVEVIHRREFYAVLGRIRFDEKGDVTGFDPVAVVRLEIGCYVPLERSRAKNETDRRFIPKVPSVVYGISPKDGHSR